DFTALGLQTDHVSWADGCKVYFKGDGWVTIRFSGTEPLLRVFAEMLIANAVVESAANGGAAVDVDAPDFDQLLDAFEAAPVEAGKPTFVIAHSHKGHPISFM
ncbi:Phosphoglucomutase/phosphomannomutase, partial [human gut metagenome]